MSLLPVCCDVTKTNCSSSRFQADLCRFVVIGNVYVVEVHDSYVFDSCSKLLGCTQHTQKNK